MDGCLPCAACMALWAEKEGGGDQTGDRIMEVIIRSPGCSLEEIVLECSGLTWNQVFTELDRMSRAGHIRFTVKGSGLCGVTSTTAGASSVSLPGAVR